jgi:hypothetical protein
MISIEGASITKLIFHHLNSDADATQILSNSMFHFDDDEQEETLKKIFLKPFINNLTTLEFKHEINLDLNVLFSISKNILNDEDFIVQSKNICQHLKSVSKHPNIKSGDVFVLEFEDIVFDNNFYKGIGIYKIENKETFIETNNNNNAVELSFKKGIGNKKLDKACLILFSNEPYTIFLIDNVSGETDYWQNEFVKVNFKKDNVNNTNQFLSLTKSFVTQQYPEDFETTKADQIDLLNRSVEYFKTHETFEKSEFEKEVLHHSGLIDSFQNFNTKYAQENQMELNDSFDISAQAVKKQARVFKSVLKLDKNFHVYIHGNRELIEQGVDADGRKFYKLYFENEA